MKKLIKNISLLFIAILSMACEKESLFDNGDPNISLVPVYTASVGNPTSGKAFQVIETPSKINLYKATTVIYHYIGFTVTEVQSTFTTEDFIPAGTDPVAEPATPGKFKFNYSFSADDIVTETTTSTNTVTESTTIDFEGNSTDIDGVALSAITGTLNTSNTIVSTTVRPKTDLDVTTTQVVTQAATNQLPEILTEIIVNDDNTTTVIVTTIKTGASSATITEEEVYN